MSVNVILERLIVATSSHSDTIDDKGQTIDSNVSTLTIELQLKSSCLIYPRGKLANHFNSVD